LVLVLGVQAWEQALVLMLEKELWALGLEQA
jgi:hypothetical protein